MNPHFEKTHACCRLTKHRMNKDIVQHPATSVIIAVIACERSKLCPHQHANVLLPCACLILILCPTTFVAKQAPMPTTFAGHWNLINAPRMHANQLKRSPLIVGSQQHLETWITAKHPSTRMTQNDLKIQKPLPRAKTHIFVLACFGKFSKGFLTSPFPDAQDVARCSAMLSTPQTAFGLCLMWGMSGSGTFAPGRKRWGRGTLKNHTRSTWGLLQHRFGSSYLARLDAVCCMYDLAMGALWIRLLLCNSIFCF